MAINESDRDRFPEQDKPLKNAGMHGEHDLGRIDSPDGTEPVTENSPKVEGGQSMKEKYIRDSGKIEDLPEESGNRSTTHLTDTYGEEKKEEYINTEERQKDIDRTTYDKNKKHH